MARVLKWTAIILGVLLLALIAVIVVFGIFRFGAMPMMARGFRGPFFNGGYGLLILPLLIGRLLIPLAFIALLLLLGFLIGRGLSRPQTPVTTNNVVGVTTCPNCGRTVQADWNHCPYCGAALKPVEPPIQAENS